MGALVDVPDVDDDEEFAAQVAARRQRRASQPHKPARRVAAARAAAAGSQFPTIEDETDAPHVTATPRVTPSGDDLTDARHHRRRPRRGRARWRSSSVAPAPAVLVTVIVAAAAFELFEGFRRAGFQPATLLALLGSAVAWWASPTTTANGRSRWSSRWCIVFTLFWYLAKVVHARPMVNAAVTLFGFSYVGVLGGFAGLLLVFPDGVGMLVGAGALRGRATTSPATSSARASGTAARCPTCRPTRRSRASPAAWPRRS